MNSEEVLVMTQEARVRIMSLAPAAGTGFHHHSRVTDHIVCLSGRIRVRFPPPEASVELAPGELCRIESPRSHSVENVLLSAPSRYLLVQGGGAYDFIRESPDADGLQAPLGGKKV